MQYTLPLWFDIDMCVCMDNLCWSTYVLPVCTIAVAWLGTVWMLSCCMLCYWHAGMQVHANNICIFLSNRYENAVLSITITGYGGMAVQFGCSKLAVWTIVKEDNEESAVFVSCFLFMLTASATFSTAIFIHAVCMSSVCRCCGMHRMLWQISVQQHIGSKLLNLLLLDKLLYMLYLIWPEHTHNIVTVTTSVPQPQEWEHN